MRLIKIITSLILKLIFTVMPIAILLNVSHPAYANQTPTVAIIQFVDHPALNATYRGLIDELKTIKVTIKHQSAQGNSALATQIAQNFMGYNPSVLVGIGTTATQALISANHQHNPPIVFSSVTDPVGAKLVTNLNISENNITGVSNFIDPTVQMALFKKIMPNLKKMGTIYNPGEPNSVTLIDKMKQVANLNNLELITAIANTSANVAEATNNLISAGVQAIFINNDNTALSAFPAIINLSNKHQLPVFCSDVDMVDYGALAALGANQYDIGRQTGKIVIAILNEKTPAQIPVIFSHTSEIKLNLEQANKLGITIPHGILNAAQKT